VENTDKNTPLHIASKLGHVEVVTKLLNKNANLEIKNNNELTPLYLAAKEGQNHVVKELLEFCDVNKQNEEGETPLHIAARLGYVEIVKFLLEKKAIVSIQNKHKQSPVDVAHISVKRLLEREVKIPWMNTLTINCHVVEKRLTNYSKTTFLTGRAPKDRTPLHLAAQHGKTDLVAFLIENNGDINSCDEEILLYSWHCKLIK
jgi:ankyrin repeat protein